MSYKFEPCTSQSCIWDSYEKIMPTVEEAAETFYKMFKDVYGIINYNTEDSVITCYIKEILEDKTRHYSFMGFSIKWVVDNNILSDEEAAFVAAILANVSYRPNIKFNNILNSVQDKFGVTDFYNSKIDFCNNPYIDEFVVKPEEFLKHMEEIIESQNN